MEMKQRHKGSTEVSFDLADLVGFLWQTKGRIVLSSAAIIFAGIYYISGLPLIYSASSRIVLGDNEPSFSLPSVGSDFGYGGETILDTYIEFIRSRQFIGGVVDEMELTNTREFRVTGGFHSLYAMREHAIDVLLGSLMLNKIGDTYLLKVTYNAKDPNIAADVANFIGPAFFVYHAKINIEKANDTSKWLNDQLGTLQNKLVTAEDALQVFIEENQLIGSNSQIEFARAEILILLEEKLAIEKTLATVKSSLSQIDSAAGDVKKLKRVDYIINHPMMVNIRSNLLAKRQAFSQVSKRYKNKHHRYIAAIAAVEKLEGEEQQLIEQLIAGIRQNVSTYEQRLESLNIQRNKVENKHSELSRYELQLTKLRRGINSTQSLYEVFVSRLQETQMLKDLGTTNQFSVVDYASIPISPTKPRKVMLLVVVCLLAVVFSIGLWLLLHLIADKKTRFTTLLRNHGVALLGELPKPEKSNKGLDKKLVPKSKIPTKVDIIYSESVRALRSEIMVRSDDVPIRTLLLASVQQGKRRSKLAIKLAESFGGLDKSMLVDADLRNPQIGIEYGLEQRTPGLTNFISRKSTFSESSFREKDSQLSVMPSGTIPNDPLVYLTKPRLGEFIKKLGVLFEQVIIETPPVNIHNDTLVISKLVDAVVLLCDLEVTESADLFEAIQRFQDTGAPLLGVVFENAKNIKSKIPQPTRGKF
jgi:receptor protein-tyrosine kinase